MSVAFAADVADYVGGLIGGALSLGVLAPRVYSQSGPSRRRLPTILLSEEDLVRHAPQLDPLLERIAAVVPQLDTLVYTVRDDLVVELGPKERCLQLLLDGERTRASFRPQWCAPGTGMVWIELPAIPQQGDLVQLVKHYFEQGTWQHIHRPLLGRPVMWDVESSTLADPGQRFISRQVILGHAFS